MTTTLTLGATTLALQTEGDRLLSLGAVTVDKVPLRNSANPWLPWFDTYEGDPFADFRLEGVTADGETQTVHTTALSNPNTLFLEKRDASGDPVIRQNMWAGPPRTAAFDIVFAPAAAEVGGRAFRGFTYHFEVRSEAAPIHRVADRQTWELGGGLENCTVVCRNLFDDPAKALGVDASFSTVGLDNWAALLPGNLWARWSLLPAFDMQYGPQGVMLAWFDRVSLIRSVLETRPGEDWLRVVDLHHDTQDTTFATNPKTVLFAPDRLDDTDALNLWTRVYTAERDKARAQFDMAPEAPPQIVFSHNQWKGFSFAETYENTIDLAAEFGADHVFIDPCWQNFESFRHDLHEAVPEAAREKNALSKATIPNMCCSLEFEVSTAAGGEAELKKLCDRARAKGVGILSWIAAHLAPNTILRQREDLGHGSFGIFAATESGRHPSTGYADVCWTLNLNAPIRDYITRQFVEVAKRTGLSGYLWDSFSNLGWWQIDYSKGDLRPQFDRMCEVYAALNNAGLYLKPEAVVSFSRSSCCGCHGGNIYRDHLLGYAYETVIGLRYKDAESGQWTEDLTLAMIRGDEPLDMLFRCFAHMRVPSTHLYDVPRDEWDPEAVAGIKRIFALYRAHRDHMDVRTVLKDDAGVLWEGRDGSRTLWTFKAQAASGDWVDAETGEPVTAGPLAAHCVYRSSREHPLAGGPQRLELA